MSCPSETKKAELKIFLSSYKRLKKLLIQNKRKSSSIYMYLNRKTLTKLMKQVSAKHYYYIALHIITTQKQRYVPQLIVHVDIIRAKCEFLQLML